MQRRKKGMESDGEGYQMPTLVTTKVGHKVEHLIPKTRIVFAFRFCYFFVGE